MEAASLIHVMNGSSFLCLLLGEECDANLIKKWKNQHCDNKKLLF